MLLVGSPHQQFCAQRIVPHTVSIPLPASTPGGKHRGVVSLIVMMQSPPASHVRSLVPS